MLIQLPSGPPDRQGPRSPEDCDAFEAGLRRDLASAPVVSYDAVLGGWSKRAIDVVLTLISLPLWLPLVLVVAGWAKLRHRAPVFEAHERIGYGGRSFRCLTLRLDPPSATIEPLRRPGELASEATNDWGLIADQAESRRVKWRRVLQRLPQLFNVIVGDMALVGPLPLTREELEPLKSARRYYLSARPGVVGISDAAGEDDASQYKIYAMSWAHSADALILWDALRSLRNRGELWKPGVRLQRAGADSGGARGKVIVRQRSARSAAAPQEML
jgi:lipopolysaccharide/colanic/teichoic acid biosynthesis glycosyltransferase